MNIVKYELQDILSGNGKVRYGKPIQTIANYLRRCQKASQMAQSHKQIKEQETKDLILWVEENNFWVTSIESENYISEGAEQKVYLKNETEVYKLNDSIYYTSWLDYFYNLLLNNYFFPNTAYELQGFYKENEVLYAVVKQVFVKANEPTSLANVKAFMMANGFEIIRNNDYKNAELGIILEDLHDENVLTYNGVLYFIDTVFYLEENFWDFSKET